MHHNQRNSNPGLGVHQVDFTLEVLVNVLAFQFVGIGDETRVGHPGVRAHGVLLGNLKSFQFG